MLRTEKLFSNEVEVETVILYWYYNHNLEKQVIALGYIRGNSFSVCYYVMALLYVTSANLNCFPT